jgi:hypothetical protein
MSYRNSGPPVSGQDVDRIGVELGVMLPDSLRALLLRNNGGMPSRDRWPLPDGESLWIGRFLPIIDSAGRGRTLEATYQLGRDRGFLPPGLIPFAADPGGNYFCVALDERVYFYAMDAWDAELDTEHNIRLAKLELTAGVDEFVDALTESTAE